jgi:hypothetical protein
MAMHWGSLIEARFKPQARSHAVTLSAAAYRARQRDHLEDEPPPPPPPLEAVLEEEVT